MRVYPQERLRTIKLSGGQDMNAEDLLKKAKENLRCIEWKTLTYELMKTSPLNSKINFYQYSRPVGKGEVIDFFVSHSWSDNLDFKWPALEKLAAGFLLVHGRYPTFWLDKVCIDQNNISDGLKVLPVNVMACRTMLVLCGETYVQRLWCAWELFTLFAFQDAEQALAKIMLVPLTDPIIARRLGHEAAHDIEGSPVLATLLNFNVADAMCYDPNEEAKVRRVIEAVGEERFNQRMKTLVHDVFAKRAELGKLGTATRFHLSQHKLNVKQVPVALKKAGRRMSSIGQTIAHKGSLHKLSISGGSHAQASLDSAKGASSKKSATGGLTSTLAAPERVVHEDQEHDHDHT